MGRYTVAILALLMFTVCVPCNGQDCSSSVSGCNITFNCQSSDPDLQSFECEIDGDPVQCTFPLTLDTSLFSTERHVLRVNAVFSNRVVTNSFGFFGCEREDVNLILGCQRAVENAVITVQCNPNFEVGSYLCSLDQSPPEPCTLPQTFDVFEYSEGNHTFLLSAIPVRFPQARPQYTLVFSGSRTSSTPEPTTPTDAQLNITCSATQMGDLYIIDCVSSNRLVSVSCSLDSGEEHPCTLPYSLNISTLAVGNHSILLRIQNELGITSFVPFTFTKLEVPLQPLDCRAIPMGNSFTIECAADEDISQSQCSIDNGEFFPCSLPYNISLEGLAAGTHVVVLEATRTGGAVSRVTLNFTISEGPPIGLQCTTSQESEQAPIVVTCTVQSPIVNASCSVDSELLESCGLEVVLEPGDFEKGEHLFSIMVTDTLGRSELFTFNFTSLKLDVICFAVARPGRTQITCSSSNALTSFMCSLDGGSVMPCDLNFSVTPPEFAVGGHNATFMATDVFGQMLTLFLEFPVFPELEVELSFVSSVYTVSEGAGIVEVCVNKNLRTNAIPLPLNVRELEPIFEAEAGVDFDSGTVFVELPAEAGNACVNVTIIDDVSALEGDERFVVEFGVDLPSINANPGPFPDTTVTIQDDDKVVIGFTKDTFQFTESEDAVVQVSVVGEVAQELTITLQQGAPYTSTITTTLGPGDISQIINITLMISGNDIALQPTVTFPVALSVPDAIQSGVQIGGQINSMTLFGSSSVEISDDDTVTISFSDTAFTADESSGFVTICLVKNRETAEEIAITLTAANQGSLGSDSVELVFPAGSENRVCTDWTIIDDTLSGGDQTIAITLSTPPILGVVVGEPDTSTILIRDDEAVTISFSDTVFTADESSGFVTICLVKNRETTEAIAVTVTAASQGSLGSDSVELVFPAGSENTVCTNWTIVDDTLSGGDQTIAITLSIPPIPGVVAREPTMSTIKIIDDEQIGPLSLNCTVAIVSPSAARAVLNCTDYPAGVTDGVCLIPGVNSVTPFDCPRFPFEFDISYIPTGEIIIEVRGRRADTGVEISLANVSLVIPEMDLYFYGNTPRLSVDSVFAQFRSNRGDLEYECHLTHFSGDGRTDCSNGTYFVSGIPPGDYTLRVVALNPPRAERRVIRNRLWIHGDDVYCITAVINRGWRVDGNTFTVEFTSTGIASSFECVLDRRHSQICTSPLVLTDLNPGRHHVRVIPQGCGREYRVWNQWFTIN